MRATDRAKILPIGQTPDLSCRSRSRDFPPYPTPIQFSPLCGGQARVPLNQSPSGLSLTMKATQTIKGRISGRFNGLGTVTPEMVEQRSREIALINVRTAEEFNEADSEEA